jgi:hypothetical protein
MNDKPEALRLADDLDNDDHMETSDHIYKAAAELRRLHDLVTEDSILLGRRRDEIVQLGKALNLGILRINELEAELAEQARLNGMGSEREARLLAVNAELVEALQDLYDEQNGPPLIRHEAKWHAAMDSARAALASVEASK